MTSQTSRLCARGNRPRVERRSFVLLPLASMFPHPVVEPVTRLVSPCPLSAQRLPICLHHGQRPIRKRNVSEHGRVYRRVSSSVTTGLTVGNYSLKHQALSAVLASNPRHGSTAVFITA
ncbi:hypothetical protein Bbelb_385280 [Branchiostoma belcheri]|nr:hypothetical protein Bbelb_385280 [Branchiostoma belcheri]